LGGAYASPFRSAARESGSSEVKTGKTRLDVLIFERGLAPSRERAQALLLAGSVLVNGQKATKPGTAVLADARVELIGEPQKYVGRGGLKLEGAIEDFGVAADGKVCLDVGSSTGGFTDCLLQRGAARVYAVDVSNDQLDWKLRQDARVKFIEKNARYLAPEDVAERAELVVMDVSFISATKVLPAVVPAAGGYAEYLVLIKPQFELAKPEIGKGGIVKDAALHQKAIEGVVNAAKSLGLEILGVRPSHVAGTEGNQEFFLHARAKG
jgi:23S rRNA (cytidine1920-2'-O)/16S rRNA (cytidine1409-2'-O)-methyltransferase